MNFGNPCCKCFIQVNLPLKMWYGHNSINLDYQSYFQKTNSIESHSLKHMSFKNAENIQLISSEDSDFMRKCKLLAVNAIKWYRGFLSPIMPPNCRFVPSCSVYAIDSINEFGLYKGLILTAWRILRCNPTGGRCLFSFLKN